MNRVSIRTLVLMIELLGFFVAYQCLAFIPPAKSPGATHAARPGNVSQSPANTTVPLSPGTTPSCQVPSTADGTLVPEYVAAAGETAQIWPDETAVDPNDRVEPDDSESVPSENVE